MKTFSQLSPQRRLLNFQQYTPSKIIVQCDINAWIQTHKKQVLKELKKPPKIIHQRINAAVEKKNKQNPISLVNNHQVDILEPRSGHLLSVSKLKLFNEGCSTKCNTQKASSISNQKNKLKKLQETSQISVSSFEEKEKQQEKEDNILQKKFGGFNRPFFQIHEFEKDFKSKVNLVSFTDRIQERKRHMNKLLSYNKVKNLNGGKPIIPSKFSRKLVLVHKSQQITKGNLTANQKNALNLILRKSQLENYKLDLISLKRQFKVNPLKFLKQEQD